MKRCAKCGSTSGMCPECYRRYQHGATSHCTNPSCIDVNAPIDCMCGCVVSSNLDGVITYEGKLIPWRRTR